MYFRTNLIERLGLLSDDILDKAGSPLDTLSNHLAGRLAYGVGERDMILMRHEVHTIHNQILLHNSRIRYLKFNQEKPN